MNEDRLGRRRPVHFPSIVLNNRSTFLFVTICTKDRRQVLATDEMHLLLRSWWRKGDSWLVGRYVILPDHLHLFCTPDLESSKSLANWLSFWKNGVAREWDGEGVLWQRNYWDTQLRHGEGYSEKWEYVRNNPVRHGLVPAADQWLFQGEVNSLSWEGLR